MSSTDVAPTPSDPSPSDPSSGVPSPSDRSPSDRSPGDPAAEPEQPDESAVVDAEKAPGQDVVLAIDIGGTKFAAGLVTARGELIDRSRVEVERDVVPEAHFASLAGIVTAMMERASDQHHARIRAVGVGSAGPVDRNLEAVSPINIPAWRAFPLRARLQELTRLPVFGDLDAKALALAEGWLGAAQGHPNFCALTVSTGIGGGVVLDGELLDGSTGNAGHIGHIIVEPGGRRCGCGAQGCLEAEASGLAIESITGRPPTEPTYEIMQRTGRLVGLASAAVCNSLDLSLVVVGGSVALGFAATFFHSAQMVLDEHTKLPYSQGARITPSRLADSGPLIGAGAVGWRGLRRARRGLS
jgi:glucokinase